jgi:glycosyltransferase involved in cell wall biosynthesis
MTPVSVLILTKNEAVDIGDCIRGLSWSDDIVVLDSMSTDATVEIAQRLGARIYTRPFDNFSAQRNFGLQEIPFSHQWVLILDADERVPDALAAEIKTFIASAAPDICGARIRRRDIWRGRWLKHAQLSPYYIRLVRPKEVYYEREVNEALVARSGIADLQSHFDHYPFSKGLSHWIAKHNQYSTVEARLIATNAVARPSLITALFDRDFNKRRTHQKAFFYRLPMRPVVKFIYMMIFRQAFLDGMPGVDYVMLQCMYEKMIVLKSKEYRDNSL